MDSCTEEEQEEFFETLEVIPVSSPSSESESGGDESCHKPAAMANTSVERQEVLLSKYEIWQNDTSSILERRQRLFTQMGIRLEREDSQKALIFLETLEQRSSAGCIKNQNKAEIGSKSYTGLLTPMNGRKEQQSIMGIGNNLSQERVDHIHGVLPQRSADRSHDLLSRLGRSGTTSPPAEPCEVSTAQDSEIVTLLRSGSSGQSLVASSFGNKNRTWNSIDMARSNSVQEGEFINQLNVGICDRSVEFANLSEEERALSFPQVKGQDDGILSNGNAASQYMEDIDLFRRIKDLDSGKEFVVNAGDEDGPWNKVKELETGRELTLEEFESSLGFSPIVQEVMKRQRASDVSGAIDVHVDIEPGIEKKKRAWFKVIKGFVNSSRDKSHHKSGRVSSLEKSGRRSSSESNDSRESPPQLAKRVKVHARKKSTKDFTDLYLLQEIQAHEGAIWTMKFSFDGFLLASAGQDKVVRVWEVVDRDRAGHSPSNITKDSLSMVEISGVDNPLQCHSGLKGSLKESAATVSSPQWSTKPFLLLEKPKHAFRGHKEDILDLSWSQSQRLLLSSSMDKTVRLWNVMTGECTRIFAHNDYVTCIHFNPVDDGYFISGSLDGKVRIWSTKDRQVVDWVDLCEMVTAACYTQNGQGAVIGSYRGTCHVYKTYDRKLQFDTKFEVQRKRKKRSQGKKITGFQFVPGDEGKILITSSDSRIRVYDGSKVCSKYMGLRNSNSQISASFSLNGMYVICASEDSRVCIWKYYDAILHSAQKQKSLSRSYEEFFAQHVSIAIPWPGSGLKSVLQKPKSVAKVERKIDTATNSVSECELNKTCNSSSEAARDVELVHDDMSDHACDEMTRTASRHSEQKSFSSGRDMSSELAASPMLDSYLEDCCSVLSKAGQDEQNSSHAFSSEGRVSAAGPEDGLPSVSFDRNSSHEDKATLRTGEEIVDKRVSAISTAWGLVIVTAGLGGEIQVFQNQAMPALIF